MKNQFFIFAGVLFSIFTYAQNVNIPDANFKAYLINNPEINTNGDSEIQVSEASNFTGMIQCSSKNIASLTGLEAFTGLVGLWCEQNQLTNIDVSKNTALQFLQFNHNQIKSIDVSKNTRLTFLETSDNQLTSLDVSQNIALIYLHCYNNKLTSLDVRNNEALIGLMCLMNQIKSLDVSKNVALNYLYCYDNQLTSLDVSHNPALSYLYCQNNQITNLDVSKNTNLANFQCQNNQLKSLNIKNGNNIKIVFSNYTNNTNLTCIQVDNVTFASSNWLNKDSWANYNIDCNYMSVTDVQKSKLKLYPNPVKSNLTIQTDDKLIKAEIYSITGQIIKTFFQKNINVDGLQKGNYLIKIITDKAIITEKIIKQ